MKSLQHIMDYGKIVGASDIDIIREYLSQMDVSREVAPLLVDIMQMEIDKLTLLRRNQLTWGVMSWDFYYKDFPQDVASKLVSLTLKNIAGVPLSDSDKEWCEENIPKYKIKSAFFTPLLDDLHRNGYFFKNEKHEETHYGDGCLLSENEF